MSVLIVIHAVGLWMTRRPLKKHTLPVCLPAGCPALTRDPDCAVARCAGGACGFAERRPVRAAAVAVLPPPADPRGPVRTATRSPHPLGSVAALCTDSGTVNKVHSRLKMCIVV